MNIINNNITYNAIDDLYNQVTGLPYSASAAAGNAGPGPEPVPVSELTVTDAMLKYEGNFSSFYQIWSVQFNFTTDIELPEGWNGVFEATNVYHAIYGDQPHANTDAMTFDANSYSSDHYETTDPVWVIGDAPVTGTFKIYNGDTLIAQGTTDLFVQPEIENIVIVNMTAVEQDSHEYLFGFEVTTQDFDFTTLPTGWRGEAIYTDPETWEDYRMCVFNSDNVASSTTISMTTSFENTPADQAYIQIHIYQSNNVELYEGMGVITITPYVSAKFTLNSVMIDGPYSGGPFSNVYNCHYNITFNETPPADCENGYGGYNGYTVITGVCVADVTGVIKDTGNYQINGIVTEYDHPDDYQYQNGDPTYPYGQTFGPATLTITDGDGNVWATATTDNVTMGS